MWFLIISVLLIFWVYLATILPIFVFKKYFLIELSNLKIFLISLNLNFLFLLIFIKQILDFTTDISVYFWFTLWFLYYFWFFVLIIFLLWFLYFLFKSLKISFKKFFLFNFSIIFSGILIWFLYFWFLENFFKPHYDYQNKKIIFATKIYKNLEVWDKIVVRYPDAKFDFEKEFFEINKKENWKIIIFSEKFWEEYKKWKVLEEKEILWKVIFETWI